MEFLLFLCFAAVAVARPDVGLGYNYQPPATSYGVPSGSIGGLNSDRQYYHAKSSFQNFQSGAPDAPSTSFETPIHGASRFAGGGGLVSTAGNTLSSGNNQGFATGGFNTGGSGEIASAGGSNFNLASRTQNTFSSSFTNQEAEVQKHLYFYAAPEEPEEVQTRINIPVAPPKKNVKIIIIKAPTYRGPGPVQIPLQPQIEEKTRVYVLVKKPDEQEQIVIPSAAPTAPIKPEVYFIKYKTQQEAADAITNVQSGSDSNAISANSFEGEQDLISTLARDSSHNNVVFTDTRSGADSANLGGSTNFGGLSSSGTSSLTGGLSGTASTGSSGSDSISVSHDSNLGGSTSFGGLSSGSLSSGLSATDSTRSSGSSSISISHDSDSNLGGSTSFGGLSSGSLSAGLSATDSTGSSGSISHSQDSSSSGSTESSGSVSGFEGSISGGSQDTGFAGFQSTGSTSGSGSLGFGVRGGFAAGSSSAGTTGGIQEVYGPPKYH